MNASAHNTIAATLTAEGFTSTGKRDVFFGLTKAPAIVYARRGTSVPASVARIVKSQMQAMPDDVDRWYITTHKASGHVYVTLRAADPV